MPKKRDGEKQIRVHVWLFESDWEELKALYSDSFGPSKFVRMAVRLALRKVRERMNDKQSAIAAPAIDIGDLEPAGFPATAGQPPSGSQS